MRQISKFCRGMAGVSAAGLLHLGDAGTHRRDAVFDPDSTEAHRSQTRREDAEKGGDEAVVGAARPATSVGQDHPVSVHDCLVHFASSASPRGIIRSNTGTLLLWNIETENAKKVALCCKPSFPRCGGGCRRGFCNAGGRKCNAGATVLQRLLHECE